MWGIELLVMGAMIAINSVFAAYEIALASVSLARLEVMASEKKKGAAAAAFMKKNLEASLAGIQLGITLVAAIAAATGGAGAEEQLAPSIENWLGVKPGLAELLAIVAVVAPLTICTIIFGELIPKVFALRNKEWVCLTISPGMKLFVTVVRPLIWVLERVVTGFMSWGERRFGKNDPDTSKSEAAELQELRAIATLARTSRMIGVQEERIIIGAAGLTSQAISQIMLPADAISMLPSDSDIGDAIIRAHLDMHTRFPVTERAGDPQAIVGYVNFKDILAHMRLAPQGGESIRKITRHIPSFPETAMVSNCLEKMIHEHVHIALVRDQAGQVIGMITLEDIIEELVGDIEDEFDHLPTHLVPIGSGWVAGGGVPIDRIRETTGIVLPTHKIQGTEHLSNWICTQLGRKVIGGEILELPGLRIVVRKVRRQQVMEAQLTVTN